MMNSSKLSKLWCSIYTLEEVNKCTNDNFSSDVDILPNEDVLGVTVIKKIKPECCDVCKGPIGYQFYDAKTIYGPWANMCTTCFLKLGPKKLGIGYGQKYEVNSKGEYVKTAG